ncbi:hypothetical protein DL767_003352 [Monosporascus sp. MG133]|nr:hypothetical protein DL767_003352 [Monosporascus sp. MG133]
MPVTTTMFRAARPAFQQRSPAAFSRIIIRNTAGRRFQSTSSSSAGAAEQQQQQSWFKRMWESPVGLKTVHFWAPVMKWALVIAGISDFARPAEKLSLTQNAALTATGLIWTRWCFVIRPKNYLLAAVNFFLAGVGIVQCSRIAAYYRSEKALAAEVRGEVREARREIEGAVGKKA